MFLKTIFLFQLFCSITLGIHGNGPSVEQEIKNNLAFELGEKNKNSDLKVHQDTLVNMAHLEENLMALDKKKFTDVPQDLPNADIALATIKNENIAGSLKVFDSAPTTLPKTIATLSDLEPETIGHLLTSASKFENAKSFLAIKDTPAKLEAKLKNLDVNSTNLEIKNEIERAKAKPAKPVFSADESKDDDEKGSEENSDVKRCEKHPKLGSSDKKSERVGKSLGMMGSSWCYYSNGCNNYNRRCRCHGSTSCCPYCQFGQPSFTEQREFIQTMPDIPVNLVDFLYGRDATLVQFIIANHGNLRNLLTYANAYTILYIINSVPSFGIYLSRLDGTTIDIVISKIANPCDYLNTLPQEARSLLVIKSSILSKCAPSSVEVTHAPTSKSTKPPIDRVTRSPRKKPFTKAELAELDKIIPRISKLIAKMVPDKVIALRVLNPDLMKKIKKCDPKIIAEVRAQWTKYEKIIDNLSSEGFAKILKKMAKKIPLLHIAIPLFQKSV